jgi:hypothetical protein
LGDQPLRDPDFETPLVDPPVGPTYGDPPCGTPIVETPIWDPPG